MPSLNQALISGRLTHDPTVKHLPSGIVVKFSVATNETYKGESHATYHRCCAFGKTGEACAEFLHKGSLVFVQGKIQHREYMKDDVKKFSTEIVVFTMTALEGRTEKPKDYVEPNGNSVAGPVPKCPDNLNDIPF